MLAITGGKGGVGKTTTALGVAAAAARRGRKPVVVDADRDLPDLATTAGTDGKGLSRFAAGDPLDVAGTQVDGITVLGARLGDDGVVEPTLRRLSDAGQFVIVDCPAGAGEPVARPLVYAARSVVVTTGTERAIVDGRKAADMAARLGARPACVARCAADDCGHVADRFDVPVVPVQAATDTTQWQGVEAAYGRLYRQSKASASGPDPEAVHTLVTRQNA